MQFGLLLCLVVLLMSVIGDNMMRKMKAFMSIYSSIHKFGKLRIVTHLRETTVTLTTSPEAVKKKRVSNWIVFLKWTSYYYYRSWYTVIINTDKPIIFPDEGGEEAGFPCANLTYHRVHVRLSSFP